MHDGSEKPSSPHMRVKDIIDEASKESFDSVDLSEESKKEEYKIKRELGMRTETILKK